MFNLVRCRADQVRELLTLRRDTIRLVVCRLWEPNEGCLPSSNGNGLVADELHDGRDGVIIRSHAEENDVLTRLAVLLARVVLVLEERRRVGDVGAGQERNALVSLFNVGAEEQTARSLEVR